MKDKMQVSLLLYHPLQQTDIPIRVQFTDNGAGFLDTNEKIVPYEVTSSRIISERTVLNVVPEYDGSVTATILEDTETPRRYILRL